MNNSDKKRDIQDMISNTSTFQLACLDYLLIQYIEGEFLKAIEC